MIKEIKGGHLSISKNDNAFFCIYFQRTPDGSIYINDECTDVEAEPYILSENDEVVFTVGGLFEKIVKNPGQDNVVIVIKAEDTAGVNIPYTNFSREYSYDVKMRNRGRLIYTLNYPRKFIVKGIVT